MTNPEKGEKEMRRRKRKGAKRDRGEKETSQKAEKAFVLIIYKKRYSEKVLKNIQRQKR